MIRDNQRWYDTTRWRKVAKRQLAKEPYCRLCERINRETRAKIVDHVRPHKNDYDLFWDPENLQSLCASCHSGIKRIEETTGYSQSAGKDGIPVDPKHPWNRR